MNWDLLEEEGLGIDQGIHLISMVEIILLFKQQMLNQQVYILITKVSEFVF